MSRHRSRLGRLGRTATNLPPTTAAVDDAQARALARILARVRAASGLELDDDELALLDDDHQIDRDVDTWRRNARTQGIDPDLDDTNRRARLRERIGTDT